MLGFDEEKVYKGEIGDLNSRATDIDFNLGDRFRQVYGSLIGKDYSKEALLRGAARIRNQELDEEYGTKFRALDLGPLNSSYEGAKGKTEAELKAGYIKDTKRERAIQEGKATGDLDPSSLAPDASYGDIIGATNKGTRKRQQTEKERLEDRDDLKLKMARDERRFERNENRKDRAQERLLAAENNAMNLQFKYAQLAQSERVRAQERKDRAIMTLINGLGNLGAAFAI